MEIGTFSEETVKLAKASIALGFDMVERYDKPLLGGKMQLSCVRVTGVEKRLQVTNSWFPEIKAGESISLRYIVAHEDCNRTYRKFNIYEENKKMKDVNKLTAYADKPDHMVSVAAVLAVIDMAKSDVYPDGSCGDDLCNIWEAVHNIVVNEF